jgi:hypothetical protein
MSSLKCIGEKCRERLGVPDAIPPGRRCLRNSGMRRCRCGAGGCSDGPPHSSCLGSEIKTADRCVIRGDSFALSYQKRRIRPTCAIHDKGTGCTVQSRFQANEECLIVRFVEKLVMKRSITVNDISMVRITFGVRGGDRQMRRVFMDVMDMSQLGIEQR